MIYEPGTKVKLDNGPGNSFISNIGIILEYFDGTGNENQGYDVEVTWTDNGESEVLFYYPHEVKEV